MVHKKKGCLHSFLCILFSWKNYSFAQDASGIESGLGGIGIAKAASQSLTLLPKQKNAIIEVAIVVKVQF